MTQARAKKGGEIGANGEWYDGGKFIATTDHAKVRGSKASKSRKLEIRPYVWVESPGPEYRAICSMLGGIDFKYDHNTGKLSPCVDNIPQNRLELADAFNSGQMFCKYDEESKTLVVA